VVFTYIDDLARLIARGWVRMRGKPAVPTA
jgi:hypothetical protein